MPIRREKYPKNWPDLSRAARTRAGWRCEWCQAPHGAVIKRKVTAEMRDWAEVISLIETDGKEWGTAKMPVARLRFHGLVKIVLTTAHLDRNTANNEPENLVALCQRCHLNYDRAAQHQPARRYGVGWTDGPDLFTQKPHTHGTPNH